MQQMNRGSQGQGQGQGQGHSSREQILNLIVYARDHGFVINPIGYRYYTDGFNQYGCCPCDDKRLKCPCDEAESEIQVQGHCRCHLFWRNLDTYIESKFFNYNTK